MKRNKQTMVVGDARLAPLTEHILAKMGQDGKVLRCRLQRFYHARALNSASQEKEEAEVS
jgi:hypothetical protein